MKLFRKTNLSISRLPVDRLAALVCLFFVTRAMAVNYPSSSCGISGPLLTQDKINGNFVVEAEESGGWSRKVTVGSTYYLIDYLIPYRTYTVTAFRDSNGNGVWDSWEERGIRGGIYVSSTLVGIYINMSGQDYDSDGVPDWWEYECFGSTTGAVAAEDSDGDGLSNLEEYQNGTNPNAADTDGDGMWDSWELVAGYDPLDSADAGLDPDGDSLTNLQEYERGSDPASVTPTAVLVVIPDDGTYTVSEPDLQLSY